MQLERVGRVTMRGLVGQIRRQIDDLDRIVRTLLHANTATDAQHLNKIEMILVQFTFARLFNIGRYALVCDSKIQKKNNDTDTSEILAIGAVLSTSMHNLPVKRGI